MESLSPRFRSPSSTRRLSVVERLGLVLAGLGLAETSGLLQRLSETGLIADSVFHPLMLGLALALGCLGLGNIGSVSDRPSKLACLLAVLSALAGVFAFSVHSADAGSGLHPWATALGIAAILMVTSYTVSAPLAIAGLLAVLYAATWRPGLDVFQATPIEIVREIGDTLWFDQKEGALGWVFDASVSTVFPFLLLWSVLVSRTFIGSPTGARDIGGSFADRLANAVHAACRFLAPPLMVASLVTTVRSGFDAVTTGTAAMALIGLGIAWFWIRPIAEPAATPSKGPRRRDFLLFAAGIAVLMLAQVGGISLAGSAIVALVTVIALCASDPEVRRQPMTIVLALAEGGVAFARLLLAASVVGMILAVLDRSALPIDVAQILAAVAGEAWAPLIVPAMIVAAVVGAAMPGFAAYLIVIALLGPALRTVGLADLTIHLLVLVASIGASALVAAQAASDVTEEKSAPDAISGKAASR